MVMHILFCSLHSGYAEIQFLFLDIGFQNFGYDVEGLVC